MSKRKQQAIGDEDSDEDIVNVDFDFFDPIPDIDWHAIKRLLIQLFQSDSELFQLHLLTDLILSQPLLGSTVKCDGRESDPYAFLSIINLHTHNSHPSVKSLIEYLLQKSTSDKTLDTFLQSILSPTSTGQVGLVLSERLINMPVQIVPPMYQMLLDEIKWALEENEPYNFDYLLFISRTYSLSPEELAELESRDVRSKRQKGPHSSPVDGIYFFHVEDELIQKFASHTLNYSFTSAQPREKDAFGLDTGGRLALVPAVHFQSLVAALSEAYPPPT